jgi:two-component system LytT family response regulator
MTTERIAFKVDGKIVLLRRDEIDQIEAAGNYVQIFTATRKILVRETMATLEKRLGDTAFLRVHRSVIVNIDKIAEAIPMPQGEYELLMQSGRRVSISRTYKSDFEKRIGL